jgi:hypothetical protein
MKRDIMVLLYVIFLSSIVLPICHSTVTWSDNFDDGNLDGWTISGTSHAGRSVEALVIAEGNCSASSYALQATGVPKMAAYTYVSHPAGISTGSYSFDVFFNEGGTYNTYTFSLVFSNLDIISKKDWLAWRGYEIVVSDYGSIVMKRLDRANGNPIIRESVGRNFVPHIGTWTHFDITHSSTGRWMVYVNGTNYYDLVDDEVLSFAYVGFWLQPGPSIDNVVVTDTANIPGNLRVNVKDSSGNAVMGASVSSSRQPNEQTALIGVTAADGIVIFSGLAAGNYTIQSSKSGYASTSSKVSVVPGAEANLNMILNSQSSSSGQVPGYPVESIAVGVLLVALLRTLKVLRKQYVLENRVRRHEADIHDYIKENSG